MINKPQKSLKLIIDIGIVKSPSLDTEWRKVQTMEKNVIRGQACRNRDGCMLL